MRDFKNYPIAWSFHRNTNRWAHNAATSDVQDDIPEPSKESPLLPFTPLPTAVQIDTGLHELLERRCSCRDFSQKTMPLTSLSTLLHYAIGVWGKDYWGGSEFLERPIPSGGGMFPLELYVLVQAVDDLESGIYHYVPITHGLEQVREIQLPINLLKYLFMGQYPVTCAPVIFIISAQVNRTLKKYRDRGYRYMVLEAGHVAQNINLSCIGLGLQSLNLGGFFDDELGRLCDFFPDDEIALYAIAAGFGAVGNKHKLRFSD